MIKLNRYIHKIIVPAILCAVIGWPIPSLDAWQQPVGLSGDIKIVENGNSGIIITYTPDITVTRSSVNATTFTIFDLDRGTFDAGPGEPVIPERQILIAVPGDSDPAVMLVESDFYSISSVLAENAPGTAVQPPDAVRNEWFYDTVYAAEETGYLRLQRVLPITLYPVQYNPGLREARVALRIVIRIDFNADNRLFIPSRVVDTGSEELYKNLILNYTSGRNWRKTQQQSAVKAAQLADGLLFTFSVKDEGMYKITYDDLVGIGLTPEAIDPRSIKVFNNGGRLLPEPINASRPDGLIENAIRVIGAEDGSFDPGDIILFYGRGTNGWDWNTSFREIRHFQSVYSRENLYWISFGNEPGRRMETVPLSSGPSQIFTTGRALVYLEDEREKLHHSGSNWYMNTLFRGDSREFSTNLPGYVPGTDADVRILVTAPSIFKHELTTTVNNSLPVIVSIPIFSDRFVRVTTPVDNNGDVSIRISNTASIGELSEIFLDWYEIEYERSLSPVEGVVKFHAPDPLEVQGGVRYRLEGYSSGQPDVYNITDVAHVTVHEISFNPGAATAVFSVSLGPDPQQFYVVDSENYRSIPELVPAAFTDIRTSNITADMIIITPREFENAVLPLKEFRESWDNIRTEIVLLEDIYDNFSGGLQDPVALRDFVKFAFENWTDEFGTPPLYLLLFGDGNYDYLGVRTSSAPIKVPPYQLNSVFELTTRTMDDFFAYVSGSDNIVDLAVGRLPVQTVDMARGVVSKLISYYEDPFFGPWRNRIGFAADDEITPTSNTERLHTDQLETIATASYMPDYLNQRKIYLMEFPAVLDVSTSGSRKPGAEEEMVSLMNEGTLLLNYVGHGNERVLAHEWLLNREIDLNRIEKSRKQYFFYLSSCTFGRWDIPEEDSMGELLVTAADRGAIGMISASRDVFAGPNHALMEAFYRNFFNDTRRTVPTGLALMQAKIEERRPNSEKYHLLGDPSMYLELPDDCVSVSSVTPDSLKALSAVQMNGSINSQSPFAGTAFLSVFDSEKKGEHVMQNGGIVNYKLPGSSIFRGKKTIEASSGNQFSMGFVVPKDITYGGKNGRISLYVWDDESDGSAVIDELTVGGTQAGIIDEDGPRIEVLFDGRQFVSGDIVHNDPNLELLLSDQHGINITGEVGHKIELMIDDDPNSIDLSRFFEYDDGSFTQGRVLRKLTGFTEGEHTLSLRAWDNFNNSATFKGIVNVVSENELTVRDIYNYPNPFTDETQFTFQINTSSGAEIQVKIFTVSGRLVKTLNFFHGGGSSFFVSPSWDGTDDDGDELANGTYLYKLIARSAENGMFKQVEALSKLVIMK
jgi:hypothetical protein